MRNHLEPKAREALRAQIREELAEIERFEAQHGSFPDLVRAHYESIEAATSTDV